MADSLHLHYAKLSNMGDLLNKLIIEKCFGIKVERHSFLTGEMCAIGSCLGQYTYHGSLPMKIRQYINGNFTRPHVYVWGTGFINYSDCESRFFIKNPEFLAVRGELTLRNIENMTGKSYDIPTGDAGLLADRLLTGLPNKKYDVGIIPHICDLKDSALESVLKNYENSLFINVRDDPVYVIQQIATCRCILSGSLHGLIVADSFDIPNMHLVFSDRPLGDGYKFDDYYSGYSLSHIYKDIRTDKLPELNEIAESYLITKKAVDDKKSALISCFPKEFIKEGYAQ